MDLLAPYLIADSSKFNDDVPITFNIEYQKFLENTPKRSETAICLTSVSNILNYLMKFPESLQTMCPGE